MSKLNFKNGFFAQIECSHPEGMPQPRENWNWDATTEVFGVKLRPSLQKLLKFRWSPSPNWGLVSKLIFKNGFWAPIESSHPECMPQTGKKLKLGRYSRTFWGETTAKALNVAQLLVITSRQLEVLWVNWFLKTDFGLKSSARTQNACHRLEKILKLDAATELFGVKLPPSL